MLKRIHYCLELLQFIKGTSNVLTLFRKEETTKLTCLKEILRKQIQQLPQMVSIIGNPEKVLRYEYICEDINPLYWLHNQNIPEKLYWSDRDQTHEVAGVGVADCLYIDKNLSTDKTFEYLNDQLSDDNPRLKYYGGFPFDKNSDNTEWGGLNKGVFIIPHFEFFKTKNEVIFAFNIALKNVSLEKIEQTLKTLDNINFDAQTHYRKVPQIQNRIDCPNEEQWTSIFKSAKSEITQTTLQKAVLARRSEFEFDVNIRPSALIAHLKRRTPNCFHFCIQLSEHHGFLGSSPERLFKISNNRIESEALAGTIKRGQNSAEDKLLENKLINSKKNQIEHGYVVTAINETFTQLCKNFEKSEHPQTMQLKEAQHLVTYFKGELKENTTVSNIFDSLNPTPAVAGEPREAALNIIKKYEPFERGWYAGTIGSFGKDDIEFAVGIRSGLVDNNKLFVYAGAGIVDGSNEKEEWEEIENKIGRFMKVFNHD